MKDLTRREFLQISGAAIAGGLLASNGLFPNQAEAAQQNASAQEASDVISLPKGGGAIKGIGETFQPNLFTGTGNFSVPIFTSPSRNGFGPKLILQYSTGNGNSEFGLGWQLSIPRVTRKTEKGLPTYTNEDVFVMSGAEDLVPVSPQPTIIPPNGFKEITRYRPRTEGLFAKIEKWVRDDGDVHWRATTKENVTSVYGKTLSARIAHPNDTEKITKVYEWLLEETFDAKGNHILYEYIQENPDLKIGGIHEQNRRYTQAYIRRILYGNTPDSLDALPEKKAGPVRQNGTNHTSNNAVDPEPRHYVFEVLFDYFDLPTEPKPEYKWRELDYGVIPNDWPYVPTIRPDPFSTYRSGFEIRTLRLCRRVLMLHHFKEGELIDAPLVKSTDFTYGEDPHAGFTFLKEVTVSGYRKDPQDSAKYLSRNMPPVSFEYSEFKPQKQRYQSVHAEANDFPPRSLNDPDFTLVDLFGDGLPDILNTRTNGYYYWRNIGEGKIKRRNLQQEMPAGVTLSNGKVAFGDMGGDGLADLILEDGQMSGFYEATPDGKWKPFKRFRKTPTFSLSDPNTRLIDLTGDGLSDVLTTREHDFLWFRCRGEDGYDEPKAEQRIHNLNDFPDVCFSDPGGRVRLADMNGDGLDDIVMVHSGRIDYWPNLGYNKWGKRTTMANAPHFGYGFDPKRLLLVDLDRTGCADLVYVESGRVRFWFNQSGNGWSDEQAIEGTPAVTDATALQFSDFFGTGTACLVWSYDFNYQTGGNYKILDFCGCRKPHLLVEMSNNMGATTRAQYASSTKFYLEDKKAGNPWVTNLPFPAQVLEKTEIIDHIGKTKLVTTYKYHHGYFDGREREFRGFGRVDQLDTEEFNAFAGTSLHDNAEFTNHQKAFHVPPVLTKTWFHTGICFDENLSSANGSFYGGRDMMDAFRGEFYKEDKRAFLMGDHEIERTDTNTRQEACRALRGSVIRTELYALDRTEKAKHPYTVIENRYQVSQIQPRAGNHHGSYLSSLKESFSYHYERIPEDPRITHQLNLKYDNFGNLEESIIVSYPRRNPLLKDDGNPFAEQAKAKAMYTFNKFINKDEQSTYYYVGLPCETKAFEVHGPDLRFRWPAGDGLVTPLRANQFDEIRRKNDYERFEHDPPGDLARLRKRIVEWTRQYYRKDEDPAAIDSIGDLSHRLEFGKVESLALQYGSYLAAFTHDYIQTLLPVKVDDEVRLEGGGYHREIEDESGPDADQSIKDYWWIPTGRQSFNSQIFFLSEEVRDTFGNASTIQYDEYGVLIRRKTDAVQNEIVAENDYRVLQPFRVRDPNDNYSQAAFDALGLVVGTAVWGEDTDGNRIGDFLDNNFVEDLDPDMIRRHLDDPLNNNAAYDTNPHHILKAASTRLVYDLKRYGESGEPNVVYTLAREIHARSLGGDNCRIQHSFIYSDGFGREVQSKVQAEAVPGTNAPRWRASGSKVYNNKGKPVREFEPFFSGTHHYGIEEHGVSPILFYDPLERVVSILHPNHTYEKIVFDPWRQVAWDAIDTIHPSFRFDPRTPNELPDPAFDPVNDLDVGQYFRNLSTESYWPTWYNQRMVPDEALKKWPDTDGNGNPLPEIKRNRNEEIRIAEKSAAEKAACHAATPAESHFDCLGRVFLTCADNGKNSLGQDQYLKTYLELDIEGNNKLIVDPRNIKIFRHVFDLAGRKIKTISKDAGTKINLPDISGERSWYLWDAENNETKTHYDALRRPREISVKKNDQIWLVNQIIYGDEPEVQNAKKFNLRGKPHRIFDDAGELKNVSYDFKGKLLENKRSLLLKYDENVNWETDPKPELEENCFGITNKYDALNRVTENIAPDGTSQEIAYNAAGLLETVKIRFEKEERKFVNNIEYNAKGQRVRIEYENGVVTEHTYEPETFRLSSVLSKKSTGTVLQDLRYTYDPVGNIITIHDAAFSIVFNHNQRIDPVNSYKYDSVYRLIEAKGREHEAMTSCHYQEPYNTHTEFISLSHQPVNNGQAIHNYTQYYTYDDGGNITKIKHMGFSGWTRSQEFSEDNNRMKMSKAGCTNERDFEFPHDSNGNITKMPHLREMKWDYANRLVEVEMNVQTNVSYDRAFYNYDAAGQRVRKVIEQGNKRVEEQICIGGYEIYRKYNHGVEPTFVRSTFHVMDVVKRIALLEKKVKDTENIDHGPDIRVRYQMDNHLGSSLLELDETAKEISYEEYYSYGGSAYIAGENEVEVKLKRYRYSGKERDEETGLYYYGARYYAPWLCRWCSCDPIGASDTLNIWEYCYNNPVNYSDLSGMAGNPINSIAQHNKQGLALRDSVGNLTSRSEHIWAKGVVQRVMRQKLGDTPLYTRSAYNLSVTLKTPIEVGKAKDLLDTAVMREFDRIMKSGGQLTDSMRFELSLEGAIEREYEAYRLVGIEPPAFRIETAAHYQAGKVSEVGKSQAFNVSGEEIETLVERGIREETANITSIAKSRGLISIAGKILDVLSLAMMESNSGRVTVEGSFGGFWVNEIGNYGDLHYEGPLGTYADEFAVHNMGILTQSLDDFCNSECQYYRGINENPTPPGTSSMDPAGGPIISVSNIKDPRGGDPDRLGGD